MEFFFDPQIYNKFYNCTSYDYNSIPLEKRRHLGVGIGTILLGLMLQSLYALCLDVMFRHKLYKESCYKLMIYLGVVNITLLFVITTVTGIINILGIVFCQAPYFLYFVGLTATSLYNADSVTHCILALNRFLAISKPSLADSLFDGKRTLLWLLLPTSATLWRATFQPPYTFNVLINTFYPNPHRGYIDDLSEEAKNFYYMPQHQYLGGFSVVFVLSIYVAFLGVLICKRKQTKTTFNNSGDKNVFMQVAWISLLGAFVGICYPFAELLQGNAILVFGYTYGYVVYQGSPAVIYLLLNRTIRSKISLPKCLKKVVTKVTGISFDSNTLVANQQQSSKMHPGARPQGIANTSRVHPATMP